MVVRHLDVEFRKIWLAVKALLRDSLLVFNSVQDVLYVSDSVVTPVLIVSLSGFELVERSRI